MALASGEEPFQQTGEKASPAFLDFCKYPGFDQTSPVETKIIHIL